MLRGLDGYLIPTRRRAELRRLGAKAFARCSREVISPISVANVRFSSSGRGAPVSQPFGGHSEGETPLPIPNREVKPLSADGTWFERAWESRSPPIDLTGRPRGRPVCVLPAVGQQSARPRRTARLTGGPARLRPACARRAGPHASGRPARVARPRRP